MTVRGLRACRREALEVFRIDPDTAAGRLTDAALEQRPQSVWLDTNILSHHMRGAAGLTHRFIQHSGRLTMRVVVLLAEPCTTWITRSGQGPVSRS
jgi:hypothetical protein